MNKKFDVIIVGAGPSGCAAAFDLAQENLDVLLLDRRRFPRVKPCGGALTARAIGRLRFSIEPVVRSVINEFAASRELTQHARFSGPAPVSVLTVRQELDDFVLRRTLQAGARFTRIGRITEILETDKRVTVATGSERFTARFLIGADGANSTVRRLTGQSLQRFGFAIEGHVAASTTDNGCVWYDFGVVPRGYGRIFPKGDHFQVGIYTYDARFRLSKQQLLWYVQRTLQRSDVFQIVGAPLGMGGWNGEPRRGRVFLVGDAAGLCEPLLGEGLHNAIQSGQIAAKAILAELAEGTTAHSVFRSGMNDLQATLRVDAGVAHAFYRNLGIGYLALTSPIAQYSLMRGYSLGLHMGRIPAALPLLPFLGGSRF